MTLTVRWCSLLVVVLSIVARPALAQDVRTLKGLSLEQLGGVEVFSVSKTPEEVWTTPAAIFVLTQTDIERSGVTTIPDALRLVPGVNVARIDTSRNWVVGIRGFGDQFSKSVLVLVDGRSVYTPLWGGVHWPISDTLLEDVERIEVIRGPGGTIWGANAQNGVINIITKPASETHGLYTSVLGGSVGDGIVEMRYGGGTPNLHYRAYAKASTRGPQFHPDGRDFDTWGMGQVGFRLDGQRGRDRFTITGDAYKAALGESVRVATFAPPAQFLVDEPLDVHGFNLRARWLRTLQPGSSISLQAYADHSSRLGTDFGERRSTFDLDFLHQWAVAPRHHVTWGAGVRTSPGRITQTRSFSDFTPHDHTLNLITAFAQEQFHLVPDRVTLTGGLKVEHNTYTGWNLQPSGRALWRISDRNTVWGGLTRAVRTPSRVDEDISVSILAATEPLTYGVVTGNRALRPETVVGLEAGYRALLGSRVYVDVAMFRNGYDDLLDLGSPTVRQQETDGVPYTAVILPWFNGIEGTTSGFELTPEWQVSDNIRIRSSYSHLNIRLEAKPDNTVQQTLPALAGGSPAHQVTLQSLLTFPGNIQVDPAYRYVSARAALSIPAYHTADVRVWLALTRGFEFSVVGQNLLDPHHPEWARDPGPTVEIRRSVYARLTWRH
jgi:iron complex outermembrane receptor protein